MEIVSHAQLAMVNFRFAPKDLTKEQIDELNTKVCERIVDSGFALLFTTVLHNKTVIRFCGIHPETTIEEIQSQSSAFTCFLLNYGKFINV